LKDRIGSQILTHYPETIRIARTITEQEAKLEGDQKENISVPGLAMDLIEQIGFEARESAYIDSKSGVSARMSISAFENLVSAAELRGLKGGNPRTSVRLADFTGIIPALTGKMELVYEGEQEGSTFVAEQLIGAAVKTLFESYFPKVEKLEKPGQPGPYQPIVDWFFEQDEFVLSDDADDQTYHAQLDAIPPLEDLIRKYQPAIAPAEKHFLKEFVLWGLVESKKLSKSQMENSTSFSDQFSNYVRGGLN
jgi:magnesium chelatase subunit I